MALVLADRVQETTNTTGTGTLTLAGAVSGFDAFTVIGNANTTYYTIVSGTLWETGVGTYTLIGTTLSRDTVFASSAAGAKIAVTAGAFVFCSYPAHKAVYKDASSVVSGFPILLPAGTASVPPLDFIAGTNLTTAQAGAVEYDGNAFYSSVADSTRGVVPSEQMVVLSSNNTLTSQTAAQPIFDGGGGPAGGAVTLPIGTYIYEMSICITGMSATSGSFGFAFGGTSTETFSYSAQAAKAGTSLTTPMAMVSTCGTGAITTLVANSTGTVGQAVIRGIIRVTVAGTVIPQISLTVAAAAVIQANGYFKLSRIGNATVNTVGNWS